MSLPQLSGRKCVRALERGGFAVRRQRSTHITMVRDKPFAQVVVPDHDQIDRGTLRAIIRRAGLTVEQFLKLLK